jgi:hypothetical protein
MFVGSSTEALEIAKAHVGRASRRKLRANPRTRHHRMEAPARAICQVMKGFGDVAELKRLLLEGDQENA